MSTYTECPASDFRPLLGRLVEGIPGVLGAVFADEEGEAVDLYVADGVEDFDLRVAGAHWGCTLDVIRQHLDPTNGATCSVFIFGEQFSYVVHAVSVEYFFVIWARPGFPLGKELAMLEEVSMAVRREM